MPEILLWSRLKNNQLNGLKFRRQYSIGKYIVDFYCPKLKLAIEIDGDSHYNAEARVYDENRDRFICSHGVRIIRFTNNNVIRNIEGVISEILRNL